MKSTIMSAVLLLVVLLAFAGCDKKEEVYPFEKSKIKNIRTHALFQINGSLQQGYLVMHVGYDGNEISYITTHKEYDGKSELSDSTRFFYVNGKLDNAIRTENRIDMLGNSFSTLINYNFVRNSAGEIITAASKRQNNLTPDYVINYAYREGNLIAVTTTNQTDSIFYNSSGQISNINGYYSQNSGGGIKSKHEYFNYKSSYNPYFLINERLGYPFMSGHATSPGGNLAAELPQHSPADLSVTQYEQQWTIEGQIIKYQNRVELLYDVDKRGRVTAQYTQGNHNKRTIFEYY